METTTQTFNIRQYIKSFNEKPFITMAGKLCNLLSTLLSVVVVIQFFESHGQLNLEFLLTVGVCATMYALGNKCQTYLLKLKIENLISGNEIPTFGEESSPEKLN